MLTQRLNRRFHRGVASRFVITLGDEFQAILNDPTIIVWVIENEYRKRDFRLGFGFGTLHTPLQRVALNMDGRAQPRHRASRIEEVKDSAFLVWAHVLLVSAIANYHVRDPLHDDHDVNLARWRIRVVLRSVVATGIVFFLSSNGILSTIVAAGSIALSLARQALSAKWCAEVDGGANITFALVSFAVVKESGSRTTAT